MTVSLEKLVFKVGDKTIELTEEEARDFKAQLDHLFSVPSWYIPQNPIVIREYPYIPWYGGTICRSHNQHLVSGIQQ